MKDSERDRYQRLEVLLFKLRRSRWLHRRAAKYYHPRHVIMVAITFLISQSIGILGIVGKDSKDDDDVSNIVGYVIGVVSILNGFLTLMTNTMGYKTKVNNNKLVAQAIDLLITQVNFELQFPSDIPIKEFAIEIEEEIIKIKNNYKVIPEERFERELNTFLKNNGDIASDAGYTSKVSFLTGLKSKFSRGSNQAENLPPEDPPLDGSSQRENIPMEVTRIQVEPYHSESPSESPDQMDESAYRSAETVVNLGFNQRSATNAPRQMHQMPLSPFSVRRDLKNLRGHNS